QVPIDISVVHEPAFEDFGLLGRGRTKHAFSQGLEQYSDISRGFCLRDLPRIGSGPTFQSYSVAMFIFGKGTLLVQGVAEEGKSTVPITSFLGHSSLSSEVRIVEWLAARFTWYLLQLANVRILRTPMHAVPALPYGRYQALVL